MRTKMTSLLLLMCIVSCTSKLHMPDEPQVDMLKKSFMTAEVAPLAIDGYGTREYVWTDTSAVGVYGSQGGENCRWIPRSQYLDSSTVAVVYGPEAAGDIYAYLPYSAEGCDSLVNGRVPVKALQSFHEHPADHLMANSVLVTKASGDSLSFDYALGLLHLTVRLEITGNVRNIVLSSMDKMLSDGGNTVEVSGIDRPCTKDAPLSLWVAVPAETYNNFTITVSNGVKNTVRPVEGTFTVLPKTITECPVSDKEYDYGLGDFEIENGEYL